MSIVRSAYPSCESASRSACHVASLVAYAAEVSRSATVMPPLVIGSGSVGDRASC
jgi:hypothetical protein